ncbi:vWA domain-containing protein [Oceanospirillum sp.]|uniref:vWA domain-containing protein n=1 Tax=Oceanospirillum sp. TaxID=2021254 RepID=UPI003A8DE956
MLIDFFNDIRKVGVPVSLRELLDLLAALEKGVAFANIDDFYLLSRTCLVKDESYYDRFDRAFGAYFNGLEGLDDLLDTLIPDEWIRKEFEKMLTPEEREKIKSLGSLQELLDTFKERLEEQQKRHAGGNKWIGTGGTSPFGAYGYNPEGIRIGQDGNRHNRAVKVWDKRQFKNLDDSVELGTRNIKVALKRLRQFARSGAASELDLDDTIRSTAHNGGMLDLKLVPERHNSVKVLLFFDVGGSMDGYIKTCEELFSACRTEFKHLEYYYFHNFIYESVWQNNLRRFDERIPTYDLLHKYASDYKVIFIGDASMSPYEIAMAGGSVEHWNEESGAQWMQRVTDTWKNIVWLNPVPENHWDYTQSIGMTRQLMQDRMFPLTLSGITEAMNLLTKKS